GRAEGVVAVVVEPELLHHLTSAQPEPPGQAITSRVVRGRSHPCLLRSDDGRPPTTAGPWRVVKTARRPDASRCQAGASSVDTSVDGSARQGRQPHLPDRGVHVWGP